MFALGRAFIKGPKYSHLLLKTTENEAIVVYFAQTLIQMQTFFRLLRSCIQLITTYLFYSDKRAQSDLPSFCYHDPEAKLVIDRHETYAKY